MTWFRIGLACAVSVALVACHKTEQGVLQPIPPLAGLRYVNLVNDTGAVDFRIVNFIGDAPNAGQATFRTGGQPYGVSTNFLPPHWPVEANRDVEVRVFMNGLDPAVSSTVVFDTTMQFAANVNYTFYLYGSARTANGVHAFVSVDTVPAPAGLAFRVINLGGATVGAADVDIVPRTATAPLAGTATFANVAPGAVTGYQAVAVNSALKAVLSAPGTRAPFLVSTFAPAGVVGTSSTNPVAGTAVAGTVISAVIVPASAGGSQAPQSGSPSSKSTITVARSTDTVLVMTGYTTTIKNRIVVGVFDTTYQIHTGNASIDTIIKFRRAADAVQPAVGTTHGLSAGDLAVVAGANETEYNGWQYVMQVADTTVCLPVDTIADTRRSCSALAADTARVLIGDTLPPLARFYTSTVYSRFRYRIGSTTAATPATGTVTFRPYLAANQANPSLSNYTIPWIIYMIDRQPALSAP